MVCHGVFFSADCEPLDWDTVPSSRLSQNARHCQKPLAHGAGAKMQGDKT
jgi:hypothetical protein